MTILKNEVAAVIDRRPTYEEAEAYYEGDVPEVFSTARLRRAFRTTGDDSRLNFCRPVVDAVNDRLEIASFTGGSQKATAVLNKVWVDNELGLAAQQIHRRALTYGDAYVLAWPDEDGNLQIEYNSPKEMALVYDPENRRKKLYAVKMWLDGDKTRLNVYTATEIRKYVSNTDTVTEGSQWTQTDTVENPFGEVPVFHWNTQRGSGGYGRPEHKDAYHAQNAINKLFITNLFTIDYQGAPQRYALSAAGDNELTDFHEGDADRENVGALRNGPGELWYLKGVTQVGEFKPADSKAFWEPIKDTVRAMASLTNTPLHYFEKTGNVPSGNALRTAEAPLLKKVKDRANTFGQTWRELFLFVLKVEGISGDVQIFWKEVESLDELERWDVILKKINAGLSHAQALREGGYSEEQIARNQIERDEEAANNQFYQRKPVVRVNESHDETNVVDPAA